MLFFSKSRQGESCPASHHGGTTKTLVRDFGPSKRRKLVPRRSPLPCPRADPPLTRGNYGTSSNPARKHKVMCDINRLAGGAGSQLRTRLRLEFPCPQGICCGQGNSSRRRVRS